MEIWCFEKWRGKCENFSSGMVFREAPKLPPSASEKPDKRAEEAVPDRSARKDRHEKSRRSLLVGKSIDRRATDAVSAEAVKEVDIKTVVDDLEKELGVKIDVDSLIAECESLSVNPITLSPIINQLINSAQGCPKFAHHIAEKNSYLINDLLVQFINGDEKTSEETLNEVLGQFMIASEFGAFENDMVAGKFVEKIGKASKFHRSEVLKTKKMLEEGREDLVVMTAQGESESSAYLTLISALEPLAKMQEKFIGSGIESYVRREVMEDLAGESLNFEYSAIVKVKEELKIVQNRLPIPGNHSDYQSLLIDAKMQMRFKRRNLFILTKAPEFRDDFEVTQQFLTENLYGEVNGELDKAAQFDKNDRYRKEAGDFADQIVMKFDGIQKLQPQSAEKTIMESSKFHGDMSEIIKLIDGGSSIHGSTASNGLSLAFNFGAMKKESPKMLQVLKNICESYKKQADNLARDCLQMDPLVLEFNQGFQEFWAGAQGIMKTFRNFARDAERDENSASDFSKYMTGSPVSMDGLPTATMMDSVRKNIGAFVSSDLYRKRSSPRLAKYLDGLKNKAVNLPSVSEQIKQFEEVQENAEDFDKKLNFLYGNPGSREGWLGMGKNILSFGAAVAAAIAAGAIFVFSGGTGAAVASFVLVQTAGVLGYAGMEYALGNKEAMEPRNLAYSWGSAMLFGGAGAILAKPVGSIIGAKVASANQKLMRSRFAPLRALGKNGLEQRTAGILSPKTILGKGGIVSRFVKEFGEESFQEGFEGLGAAVAGDNPALSLVLNVLASSPHHARKFANNGSFSINQDITVNLTESNMQIRYSNKAAMLNYLQSINASSSMIREFKQSGRIIIDKGGIKIHVRNSTEVQGIRLLLTQGNNKGVAAKAGLGWVSKDTYTYSGTSDAKTDLVRMFKSKYFVEETASGDLILTDIHGVRIEVKAKAVSAVKSNVGAAIDSTRESVTKLADAIRDKGLRAASLEVISDIWSGTKEGLIRGVQRLDKIFKNLMNSKAGELLRQIAEKIDERVATSNDFTTVLSLLLMAGVGTIGGLLAYLTNYRSSSYEDVRKNLELGQRVLVEIEPGRTENWVVSQINGDGTVLVTRELSSGQLVVKKFSLREIARLNPTVLDEQLEPGYHEIERPLQKPKNRLHEGDFNRRLERGKTFQFSIAHPVELVLAPGTQFPERVKLSVNDDGSLILQNSSGGTLVLGGAVAVDAVFGRKDFGNNDRISSRHFRITGLKDGKFEIEDLSRNGIMVRSETLQDRPSRDIGLGIGGTFHISRSLGELYKWLDARGTIFNGVSTVTLKTYIEAYIRGGGAVSPERIPRTDDLRQKVIDIMVEYERDAIQAGLQRSKINYDVTLSLVPSVQSAHSYEVEFAISTWIGAKSADKSWGDIVDDKLADQFRKSRPKKLEMRFRNGTTLKLIFPQNYGAEVARIQQYIISAEQWIQHEFGQYGVQPNENLTILFMDNVQGHSKKIRGHGYHGGIIMEASSIGTADFYQIYLHERTHAVLGAHNMHANDGGVVEGIANFMGDAGARKLKLPNPRILMHGVGRGEVASEILKSVRGGMSYYNALQNYFEQGHDRSDYRLNYEYGQAFTAAFVAHFNGDLGKFLQLYAVLGQVMYRQYRGTVNEMYAAAMFDIGLSKSDITTILHETAGRLMLRAHQGHELIDMIISQSPGEIRAMLKQQNLETMLGLNNPTILQIESSVEDAKRYVEQYARSGWGRGDASVSCYIEILDSMVAEFKRHKGMNRDTQYN